MRRARPVAALVLLAALAGALAALASGHLVTGIAATALVLALTVLGDRLTMQRPRPHVHNVFTCPAHLDDCECEPRFDPSRSCNPYWVPGFCPDALRAWDERRQR